MSRSRLCRSRPELRRIRFSLDAIGASFSGDGIALAAAGTLASGLALLGAARPVAEVLAQPDQLDMAWMYDSYLAITHHLVFGTEYLWTYGPLGFIDSPLEVSRHLLAGALAGQWATAMGLAGLLVYAMLRRARWSLGWVLVVVVALWLPAEFFVASSPYEELVLASVMILWLVDGPGRPKEQGGRWTVLAGVLLAAACLVKASMLPVAAVTVVAWAIHAAAERRWTALAGLALGLTVTWISVFVTVGGGLSAALQWPVAEVPVIVGYSAMSLAGPVPYLALALFAAAAFAGCAASVVGHRPGRAWMAISGLAIGFEAFKESFVRQDVHVFAIFSVLGWLAVLLWLAGSGGDPGSGLVQHHPVHVRVEGWLAGVALALCSLVLMSSAGSSVPSPPAAQALVQADLGAIHFVLSPNYAERVQAASLAASLAVRPGLAAAAPVLRGRSVFAWPFDGNAAVAVGGREVLAPIPQSYQAYTSELDRLDARFFRQAHRPQYGLVQTSAIDGELPLQGDGLTFVSMLACYRPMFVAGTYLVVRSSGPSGMACNPALRLQERRHRWRTVRLGQWVAVAGAPASIVMADVVADRSVLGTLANIAYRSARLDIRLRLIGGGQETFQLVSRTLIDGTLVSQVLSSPQALMALWSGRGSADVQAVSIVAESPGQWDATLRIRLVDVTRVGGP